MDHPVRFERNGRWGPSPFQSVVVTTSLSLFSDVSVDPSRRWIHDRSETIMKPLDAKQPNAEDADTENPTPGLGGIWSSIGPGRDPDAAPDGPPTIRPNELNAPIPSSTEKDFSPVNHASDDGKTNAPTNSDPITDVETGIREELRVGVRMIKALDAQLKRAETLIRLQEETSRKAEATTRILTQQIDGSGDRTPLNSNPDGSTIQRETDHAIERISSVTEQAVRGLHDRLERFVSLDTRLDEFDAALSTIERRIDRVGARTTPPPPRPVDLQSRSLSVGGMSLDIEPSLPDPPMPTTSEEPRLEHPLLSVHLLVERADEVRRELRADLEAICTASATLAEIVDHATQTESNLRETVDSANAGSQPSPDGEWAVASILRRLADEIDVESAAGGRTPATSPRKAGGIDVERPVILELDPDGVAGSDTTPIAAKESING